MQCYWKLGKLIDPELRKRHLKSIVKLHDRFDSACTNPSRLMRMPDTVNQNNGADAFVADWHPERVYGLSDFPEPELEYTPKRSTYTGPDTDVDADFELATKYMPAHWVDDREWWVKVGMCHSGSGGSLEAWDAWSQQSAKYMPGEPERLWRGFRGQGLTHGTLFAAIDAESPGFKTLLWADRERRADAREQAEHEARVALLMEPCEYTPVPDFLLPACPTPSTTDNTLAKVEPVQTTSEAPPATDEHLELLRRQVDAAELANQLKAQEIEARKKPKPEAPAPTVHAMAAADWCKEEYPPLSYVIDCIAPELEIANIVAPERAGKSWLGCEAAIAVASGTKYLGEFMTKQGTVIYLAAEGRDAHYRDTLMRRMAKSRGLNLEDLPIHFFGPTAQAKNRVHICQESWRDWLCREIDRTGAIFVVIDNLASHVDVDLTKKQVCMDLYKPLQDIGKTHGATIQVQHHTKKNLTAPIFMGEDLEKTAYGHIFGDAALVNQAALNALILAGEQEYEQYVRGFVRSKDRYGRSLRVQQWEFQIDQHKGTVTGSIENSKTPTEIEAELKTEVFRRTFERQGYKPFSSQQSTLTAAHRMAKELGHRFGLNNLRDHMLLILIPTGVIQTVKKGKQALEHHWANGGGVQGELAL